MKLKDAQGYVKKSVIENMDVDICQLVVSDEFTKKDTGGNYRDRVINRLTDMEVPYATDWNTGRAFRMMYVTVKCPYCSNEMISNRGGGSGGSETDSYVCENCKARVSIEYPVFHAVSVAPPAPSKCYIVQDENGRFWNGRSFRSSLDTTAVGVPDYKLKSLRVTHPGITAYEIPVDHQEHLSSIVPPAVECD